MLVINGTVYNIGVGILYLYCCSKSLEVGGASGCGLWSDAHVHGVVISMAHMQQALDQLRSSHSDAIGAPKVRRYNMPYNSTFYFDDHYLFSFCFNTIFPNSLTDPKCELG